MVSKTYSIFRVEWCKMGALIACGLVLFHSSSLVLCKHGLLISVKNNRLQGIHKGYLSLISFHWIGSCWAWWMHIIHSYQAEKRKWLLSFGSLSGVSPFKCQIHSVLPVSGILSHVFHSHYVEVRTHLTPPEHNPKCFCSGLHIGVSPPAPGRPRHPRAPQGIPADSGAWDALRPIWCPCMHNPVCS